MRTTRSLSSALLAVGLVPAVLALPVVTAPHHAPHPVKGRFTSAVLRGVDAAAEKALGSDARRGQARTGALDPALGRPEVLTSERTTSTFSAIGVTWAAQSGPASPVVNVRVRQHGRWTAWETLALTDIGPDASSDEARTARPGTEPLLTDPSDAYQVRVDTADGRLPADIRVDVIDPGTSPADADLQPSGPAASAQAQASTPTIITRRQWGADESIRQCCPKYMSTIRAGFVHHTASSNTYTASGAAAQVRSIYLYHVKANGWSDIGYNFLVDKFGRIFEGRYGGVTSAVKGAHTGGFNQDTFGVAAIGTYSTSAPAVMVASIARVFAWKFDLNRRNPYATATLTSEGGGTSRYAAGKSVLFNNISGHRNAGYTECPGNYLYAQLGKIRALVKSYMGAAFYTPSQSAFAGTYASSLGPLVSTYVSRGMTVHFTVTDRCSGAVVRSYSGYTTTRYAPRWDLKTAAGAWARPGYYTLTMSSSGVRVWTSGYEVLPGAGTPLSACATQRISGPDVAESSVVAARVSAPNATTVVLALGSSRDLISGLIAAPLARSLDGVLLMTDTPSLPPSVRADIIRRGATTAYIVGPESSVGAGVVTELRSLGVQTVTRLVGVDRYDTAAVVARAMPRHATGAVIVSGLDAYLADGYAAAGPAAALGQPILLAGATVPPTTSSALRDLGITSTAVAAPVAGVSEAAKATLPSPSRLTGATRPAAAVAIANAYASRVGVGHVSVVSLASATVMPYALIAGAAGALTLVTTPTVLSAEVGTWVRAHAVTSAGIFGPQVALSPAVLVALAPAVSA